MLWGVCASALCCPSAPRLSCTELLTHFFIHAIYFRLLEEEEEVSKALSSALTPKVHFYSKNTRLTTNIKPGYDRIKREQPCSANEQGAGVKTERRRESHRWYTQVVRHFSVVQSRAWLQQTRWGAKDWKLPGPPEAVPGWRCQCGVAPSLPRPDPDH